MKQVRERFGPERVLTGLGRRACDGAVVELTVDEDGRVAQARVLELHDINTSERRPEHEVAWFLRRCAALIAAEGLTLIGEQDVVYYIPADRVVIDKLRFQQFCTPATERGPFLHGR